VSSGIVFRAAFSGHFVTERVTLPWKSYLFSFGHPIHIRDLAISDFLKPMPLQMTLNQKEFKAMKVIFIGSFKI
jgi:hypothetical protein